MLLGPDIEPVVSNSEGERLSDGSRANTLPTTSLIGIELFAGAGGLALGLGRAGFKFAMAVDADKSSCETLRMNLHHHSSWKVEYNDVRRLEYNSYYGIDLISAGAPCQPFSGGGRLRGEGDDRNMLPEALRAVHDVRPRAFIIENVRGLLFSRARPYFEYILKALRVPSVTRLPTQTWEEHLRILQTTQSSDEEYWVDWRVLNAADFGLPQNRHRLVVVGLKKHHGVPPRFVWPEATHTRGALVAALWEDNYWEYHRVSKRVRDSVRSTLPRIVDAVEIRGDRWQTLRDVTKLLGEPGSRPNDPSHIFVPGARLYKGHTGSILDWPGKTVKAGVHGSPGGEHIVVTDDGTIRYLTVRECAILQGFPEDYIFPPIRSTAMRQIGNAVPTALAYAVGRAIKEALING